MAGAPLAVLYGGMPADAAPVLPPHRTVVHRHPAVPWRFFGYPHIRRFPPPREPRLFFPPPEDDLPPPVEATPPVEEEPVEGPLPHGFVLTEAMGSGQHPAVPATLTKYREVGMALAACWNPPASLAWGSITLRVAFTRDGAVYGLPRIPYVDAPTSDAKTQLTRSLDAALKSCTPLPLSHKLGAAVAGEIFAIRFVNQGASNARH